MKRIFITGASGCIGHYMTEALIQNTNHELYLLVRNPDKLKFDYQARPGIHLLVGDMAIYSKTLTSRFWQPLLGAEKRKPMRST
jgi:nucleoside-diphosphate-sugar epimerase